MCRCLTLEEYFQEFIDENTQSSGGEELRLLVTDQQAQTLGYFFISGVAGFVERMRLQQGFGLEGRGSDIHGELAQDDDDADEFIN